MFLSVSQFLVCYLINESLTPFDVIVVMVIHRRRQQTREAYYINNVINIMHSYVQSSSLTLFFSLPSFNIYRDANDSPHLNTVNCHYANGRQLLLLLS